MAGNIGSDTARNFTIMGDTVNLASRLEGANKQYGSRILISEATLSETEGLFTRELDLIQVKGKDVPVRIFELLATAEQTDQEQRNWVRTFEEALTAYRAREWDRAEAAFNDSLSMCGGPDRAARVFLARIAHFRENVPESDWAGVWRMKSK